MREFLMYAAASVGAAVALYGWGAGLQRLARGPVRPPVLTIALGLATLIFIGGVLNATHLAFPGAVVGVIVIGLALSVWNRLSHPIGPRHRWTPADAIVWIVPAAVALGLVLWFSPARIYNWHDDLERYFSYPARMLATGTVGDNPLGYIGLDSLGAQGWLQSFVTLPFSFRYLDTVDGCFALVLCLVLVGTGAGERTGRTAAVSAQVALLALYPLIVNVSSVFTTTGLLLAASLLVSPSPAAPPGRSPWLELGLVYAALIALKTTNVIPVTIHGLVLLAAQRRKAPGTSGIGRTAGQLMLWTAAGLLPWVLLHIPNFLLATIPAAPSAAAAAAESWRELFSLQATSYEVPRLYFTALAIGALAGAVGVILLGRSASADQVSARTTVMVAGLTAAFTYAALAGVLARLVFGQSTSIRYVSPILAGTLPMMILFAGAATTPNQTRGRDLVPVLITGVLLLLSWPSLNGRAHRMAAFGSPLAYLGNAADVAMYETYTSTVLAPAQRDRVRRLQQLVPPGEPIVAWIMTPHWFDFGRNRIFNTDPYGLAMPWARVPKSRYLIWESTGPAVRPQVRYLGMMADPGASERRAGAQALATVLEWKALVSNADVLGEDNGMIVLRRRE